MAREPHVEPFSGGLNNAKSPSLLQDGELMRCDETQYKPNSMSIYKAPSRTTLTNTTLGARVTGLVYCAFDFINLGINTTVNTPTIAVVSPDTFTGVSPGAVVRGLAGIPDGTTVLTATNATAVLSNNVTVSTQGTAQFECDNVLVAQANNNYQIATATTGTLSFTTLETVTEGTQLEAINYSNKHVLLNGVNNNRVLLPGSKVRAHGLLPVTTTPDVNVTTGVWALETGTGFYAYWTTEYDKPNDLESTFNGKPRAVNIDTSLKKASITPPGRVNASATHFRVYRSVKLTATTQEGADLESAALSGFLIATGEFPAGGVASVPIDDGGSVSSLSAARPAGIYLQGSSTRAAWSNATALLNNPTTLTDFATLNVTTGFGAGDVQLIIGDFNFNYTTITPPIVGIQVVVSAASTVSPTSLTVKLTDNPATFDRFAHQTKSIAVGATGTAYTFGSTTDNWQQSIPWTKDAFTNGNFRISLSGFTTDNTATLRIYDVQVTITYGKAQQLGTQPVFDRLVLKPFGVEVAIGKRGAPPKATTGDIFQNQLVLNDVTDKSIVRYSFPDDIDAVPELYFLNFETRDQDEVTYIRTLGSNLVVSLRTQLFRISYLPGVADAEFDRGRAVELIDSMQGFAGPKAACVFTVADGTPLLFGVGRSGPIITDGYRVRPATLALNWPKTVDITKLATAEVVNNPESHELLLHYVPLGSATPTRNTACLRFNYHPTHLQGTFLKPSGPGTVDITAATLAVMTDGSRLLFTGTSTGNVALENQGVVSAATIRSRPMFMAGLGNEWKLGELYLHHTLYAINASSPMNITVTPTIWKTGATRQVLTGKVAAVPANTVTSTYPEDPEISKYTLYVGGEGVDLTYTMSAATDAIGLDYAVFMGGDMGRENAK